MSAKHPVGWGVALVAGIALLAAVILLFHFGPPGIKAGEDRILSSTLLTNGSRPFLVAHRTGHPIDAYEVSLFRVDQSTNVFVNWLGHEDGYWWWASLVAGPAGDKVRIRAFGTILAVYSVADGSVTWIDKAMEGVASHRIDGVKIQHPMPAAILTNR